MAESPDAEFVVDAFAAPASCGCIAVDANTLDFVGALQISPIVSARRGTDCVELSAIGFQELPATRDSRHDGDSALMDQAMVPAAKSDQIAQFGLPAVG